MTKFCTLTASLASPFDWRNTTEDRHIFLCSPQDTYMLIAKLPHRLREYRYFHCHDDLTGTPLGFTVSLKFEPCWIKGSWTLEVKGLNWNEDTVAVYSPSQVSLLRVTGVQVSISELAWCMYRAEQVVAIARQLIGHYENFEQAAELTLNARYRMVTKVVMANRLNDKFHMNLLETEHFLLTIAPKSRVKE